MRSFQLLSFYRNVQRSVSEGFSIVYLNLEWAARVFGSKFTWIMSLRSCCVGESMVPRCLSKDTPRPRTGLLVDRCWTLDLLAAATLWCRYSGLRSA